MRHAASGDYFWTDKEGASILVTAKRFSKKVNLQTFYALHPDSRAVVKLLRVTVR